MIAKVVAGQEDAENTSTRPVAEGQIACGISSILANRSRLDGSLVDFRISAIQADNYGWSGAIVLIIVIDVPRPAPSIFRHENVKNVRVLNGSSVAGA